MQVGTFAVWNNDVLLYDSLVSTMACFLQSSFDSKAVLIRGSKHDYVEGIWRTYDGSLNSDYQA
jgi:hypothetical protein